MSQTYHPKYSEKIDQWEKYQLTYDAGDEYKARYLVQYSQEEKEFVERKKCTFVPPFAKEAVLEIMNHLTSKLSEVIRESSDPRYVAYSAGINSFFTREVIPQLLIKGKVGVYVDNAASVSETRAGEVSLPYMYAYRAEEILNWTPDVATGFESLLLKREEYSKDDDGLPVAKVTRYLLFKKTASGIICEGTVNGASVKQNILDLDNIPFFVFQLSDSLLADVADYQIALFNMASSCINYDIKSNFAIYTEQVDYQSTAARQIQDANGTSMEDERKVGTKTGIIYSRGLERPQFIAPSSEPLKASLLHRETLKKEIREIVYATVTNMRPPDGNILVNGLCSVAYVLQEGENVLAKYWLDYVAPGSTHRVTYPKSYTIQSFEERVAGAEKLLTLGSRISSINYKRKCAYEAVRLVCGDSLSVAEYDAIKVQIYTSDSPLYTVSDWLEIVNGGLCTRATASTSLGFKVGEAELAEKEYAERLRIMAISQGGSLESPAIQAVATGERKTGIKNSSASEGENVSNT